VSDGGAPALAWALWAPTAKLALRVGLLLVLGVAGWAWLLRRAWVGPSAGAPFFSVDKLALYRAYPFAAAAAVVLAMIVTYLWRWWRRPAVSSRASSSTLWSRLGVTLRIVTGCLALVVTVALHFVWMGGPAVTPGSITG
jgi:hypothetical protein